MKNKGQAVVEVVVLAPLLMALIFFLGFAIFELLSRVMLSQLAEKAIICETTSAKTTCQRHLRAQLNKFSHQLRLESYELNKRRGNYHLQLKVALPLKRQLRLEKELPWSDRGPQ